MNRFKSYYQLTKPGIIRGNAVHVLAGAFLASIGGVAWTPVLGVLVGTSFVIASACVVNNYMDRGIDAKMKRTKNRASVTGYISFKRAAVFASLLALIGLLVLIVFTNAVVVVIGFLAYVLYVLAYGYAKRRTVHSTLIGAVPGALPAMAGFVAVSGQISIGAVLVFLLVLAWQMPHFYAISIFRKEEYAAAGLPVMGVRKRFETVRMHMFFYLALYAFIIALMISFRTVSTSAGLLLVAGAMYWMYVFSKKNTNVRWARSVFGASLILTLVFVSASILNIYTNTIIN